MITSIKVTSAPDLSVKNAVLNFKYASLPPERIIAGASWNITGGSPPQDTSLLVFRYVCRLIEEKIPEHRIWLLTGHSTWQPDNRIVRYHRIWGSFKAQGLDLGGGDDYYEELLETDHGLKFFGAVPLSKISIEIVIKILLIESCTYLLSLPKELSPQGLIKNGWSFHRYKVDRKQLIVFDRQEFAPWFHNKRASWYKPIFGTGSKTSKIRKKAIHKLGKSKYLQG